MTIQQIEFFLSLAKTLSFTKTAESFFTSQPTVTRQIGLLEAELGFALFTRNKRLVRLTPRGAVMLSGLKDVPGIINSAREAAVGYKKGKLRIASLELIDDEKYITPYLVRFGELYPDIAVTMEKRSFGELRGRLEDGTYDLIFTLDFELKYFAQVQIYRCFELQCMVVLSADHPLAKREATLEDLRDETFILPLPSESPGRLEELNRLFAPFGFACSNVLYTDNQESMLLNVRTGKGVALLDSSVKQLNGKQYATIPMPPGSAPLFIAAVWKNSNLNPAITIFLDAFIQ